jgi:nitrogen regulatory protein P-II 1
MIIPYFKWGVSDYLIKINKQTPLNKGWSYFCHTFVSNKTNNTMKKVETIIRKSKFEEVRDALHKVEVNFFSYWDVTGVGNEKEGHVYRGISYSTSDIQRRHLSIVVNDDFLDKTIEAIQTSARSGKVGDGKIFVSTIEDAYRIRTGESGKNTLK